ICTIICLCASVIMLSHCAPKVASTVTTTESATPDAVAEVKKNFSEAQLEEGRLVYQNSCGKCHKLFAPESRDIEKWEKVLPRMAKRAKLDDETTGKVRAYLIVHAKPK